MKEIDLTKGYKTIVDDDDYERVSKYKWYYNDGYARRAQKRVSGAKSSKIEYLARVILGLTDKKLVVDHINGDKLDNRKQNLRICTQAQNVKNTAVRSSTGYKGVRKSGNGYIAQIRCDGVWYFSKTLPTMTEAAVKYNELALIHHGEFARLNEVA